MKYYAGMQSALLGAGRCDQSSEGRILEGPKHNNHLGYLNYFNEIHPKIVATFSDKIKQYYLNTLKLFDYEIAILAHKHDLGQCTESRENESYSTEDGLFICHSKKWALRFLH